MHSELLFLFWEDVHDSSAFASKWPFSSSSRWQPLALHLCLRCDPCEPRAGGWHPRPPYLLCSGCCSLQLLVGLTKASRDSDAPHLTEVSQRVLQKQRRQGLSTRSSCAHRELSRTVTNKQGMDSKWPPCQSGFQRFRHCKTQ